jgi:hypothetical protein
MILPNELEQGHVLIWQYRRHGGYCREPNVGIIFDALACSTGNRQRARTLRMHRGNTELQYLVHGLIEKAENLAQASDEVLRFAHFVMCIGKLVHKAIGAKQYFVLVERDRHGCCIPADG